MRFGSEPCRLSGFTIFLVWRLSVRAALKTPAVVLHGPGGKCYEARVIEPITQAIRNRIIFDRTMCPSAPILYGCIFLVVAWVVLFNWTTASSRALRKQMRSFAETLPDKTGSGNTGNLGLEELDRDCLFLWPWCMASLMSFSGN